MWQKKIVLFDAKYLILFNTVSLLFLVLTIQVINVFAFLHSISSLNKMLNSKHLYIHIKKMLHLYRQIM